MAKRCGRCRAWRPLDKVRGECRRRSLRSGENYREVRKDDPGCLEYTRGDWNRG